MCLYQHYIPSLWRLACKILSVCSGFRLDSAVEALTASCSLPLPAGSTHGKSFPAPTKPQICKHIAGQLAGICSSSIWVQHLHNTSPSAAPSPPSPVACALAGTTKQDKVPSLGKHSASGITSNSSRPQAVGQLLGEAVAVIRQADGCLPALPSAAPTDADTKPEAVHECVTGWAQQAAAQQASRAAASTAQVPCNAGASDSKNAIFHPPPATRTHATGLQNGCMPSAAAPLLLPVACAAPSVKQENRGAASDAVNRQQTNSSSSHQHCLQERPARSYSRQKSDLSRPPQSLSSHAKVSKLSACNLKLEEGAADTDSPQALRRYADCIH